MRVAVWLALLAVLAGCTPSAAGSHSTSSTPAAVPWVDSPAPPYRPPAMTDPGAPAANARPCTAHDVRAAFAGKNGAAMHELVYVSFRNVGRTTCLLAGYPRVVATRPGRRPVLATDATFLSDIAVHTANMPPGGSTLLLLETENGCSADPGGDARPFLYDHVRVTVPGGGTIELTRSIGLFVACGLERTRFYDPDYPQPRPDYPLAVLRPTVELPRTVRAGTVLHFDVVLRNPTSHAVRLDPCPGFVETVEAAVPAKRVHTLNCASVRAIGPGRSVRYAMQLPIAADETTGRTGVAWDLQVPGPVAHGVLVVTH